MPATLPKVSIFSNNPVQNDALIGDSVILIFTASEPITDVKVEIGTTSKLPADSIINMGTVDWAAILKLPSSLPAGDITFTIDFTTVSDKSAGTQVDETTDGSEVVYALNPTNSPKYANTGNLYENINRMPGDFSRDKLVSRSNEEISGDLSTVFLNLVDFELDQTKQHPSWLTELANDYATQVFWAKSNGTPEQYELRAQLRKEAEGIKIERFFPQEYR